MSSPDAAALPSRSPPSVKRRKSEAASSSSGYAVGKSRASTGSSGVVVAPENSAISASKGSAVGRGRLGALVAQQLDHLRGQRPQQVGLEAA